MPYIDSVQIDTHCGLKKSDNIKMNNEPTAVLGYYRIIPNHTIPKGIISRLILIKNCNKNNAYIFIFP